MTPQIPEYLIVFESTVRPLVAAIALGLIWMGAMHMKTPARSRYAIAGVLSVAQHLGSANTYLATIENPPAVPTVLFGLMIPLIVATIGFWRSGNISSL